MLDKNIYIKETLLAVLLRYTRVDLLPTKKYMFFDDLPRSANDVKHPYEYLFDYLQQCKIKPPAVGINSADRRYIKGYQEELLKIVDQLDPNKPELITQYDGEYSVKADFFDMCKIYKPVYDFEANDCFLATELSMDDIQKLIDPIGKYLSRYINNELEIIDKSFLRFENQKKHFIKFIAENQFIEKYGKNFVIEYTSELLYTNQDFLFVHTLFALEILGYIELKGFWFRKVMVDADYFANVTVTDLLIEEINQEYRKQNPETTLTNFSADLGVITLMGKEIELSKKGKETDAMSLMGTLYKTEDSSYVHNDEIFEDWGYSLSDAKGASKNKIYFAGQKINTAVQLVTGIEDFIEFNTTKARINPKYRKEKS